MYYFDYAATSLRKPPAVADAVYQAIASETIGNASRGGHETSIRASRIIFEAREQIKQLMGASQYDVVFTKNATEALNVAIKGMFDKGDHLITTILEHNSVLRPLYELEQTGISLDFVSCDNQTGVLLYDEFEQLINHNTKAIVVTAASNVTGVVTNLEFLSRLCQKHDLKLIIDGAQAAGIVDICLDDLSINVFCFTSHKSLYGPQGIGGMCVRIGTKIRPVFSGGSGHSTFSKTHPRSMPELLEAGTANVHGVAGLVAGVSYVLEKTVSRLTYETYELTRYFYEQIRSLPGIHIYAEPKRGMNTGVVSFNIGDHDASEVALLLEEKYGILIRPGAHCAPLIHAFFKTENQGIVRFSFSAFNTMDEVKYAVATIENLVRGLMKS